MRALQAHGATHIFGIPGHFARSFFRIIEESAILPLHTLSHEPSLGFAADAEIVAKKILTVLDQPYTLRWHLHQSTPSIGIVVFKGDQTGSDELLKMADLAMYHSKTAGRNTARFFDPAMEASVSAHALLEQDMRRGLARQEFMLLYQFQVDVHGVPIDAKALLRWNHSTRGQVPPAQFITLAQQTS